MYLVQFARHMSSGRNQISRREQACRTTTRPHFSRDALLALGFLQMLTGGRYELRYCCTRIRPLTEIFGSLAFIRI